MLYYLVQYGLLVLVCTYLVFYYSAPKVSVHVKFWSVVTWVLNFGLALLVPEDVYQTIRNDQQPALGQQYLLLYWSVYLLTWTVIPVLQQWQDAGDLNSFDRLKRSLRSNGQFYLAMVVGAAVALLVLVLLNAGGQMGLVMFLRCLATIWGLLLLVGLLGYAIAEIPKSVWRNADPNYYLLYLYQRIGQVEEDIEEAYLEFRTVSVFVLHSQRSSPDPEIAKYSEAAMLLIPDGLRSKNTSDYLPFLKQIGYLEANPVSIESSIEHHRLMRRAIARCHRQQKSLTSYTLEALFFQDITKAIQTGQKLTTHARKISALTETWFMQYRRKVHRGFAVFLMLSCLALLLSQTQVFLGSSWTVLSGLLLLEDMQIMRVTAFLVMAFVVYMANYALFRLKLANLYGLYPGQSDGASLMFATINFSRIGVALVLNFFDMMHMSDSVYSKVLGAPDMGLLGDWVIKGLPGMLWLVALTHYFNLWAYLAKKLGLDDAYSFMSHEIDPNKPKKSPFQVQRMRKQLEKESLAQKRTADETLTQPLR